ncbi:MAG: HD domain-containing protein [Patescibacteria group bacterium]
MIRKSLILKLFQGATMQRWNDKLRPIDFIESDKHGHKLVIAYVLGKYEERNRSIDWLSIIQGALFEYLQKLVLTDLKSPVFYLIKSDQEKYRQLNEYVCQEIRPYLAPLSPDGMKLSGAMHEYLLSEEKNVEQRILDAASALASKWEFDIIERADPHGFETENIKSELLKRIDRYSDLVGVQELRGNPATKSFVNLCGQLRFQTRWADLHRAPKTSVLTHCFLVGIMAYLFSWENRACPRRVYNNVFGGLFHDLAEVLTRDIINPVKRSVDGLRDLIIEYEKIEMERTVYPLLADDFKNDIKLFTEIEQHNRIVVDGRERRDVRVDDITAEYNQDRYDPCDGELVKAADDLNAFIEAYEAVRNGAASERFHQAMHAIRAKYEKRPSIGTLNLTELFADFIV